MSEVRRQVMEGRVQRFKEAMTRFRIRQKQLEYEMRELRREYRRAQQVHLRNLMRIEARIVAINAAKADLAKDIAEFQAQQGDQVPPLDEG